MRKTVFRTLIIILASSMFIFGAWQIRQRQIGFTVNVPSVSVLAPTPTAFPFEEITIPLLRARSYTSRLGANTPVAQQPAYDSFLTSYDSDGLQIHALLTQPRGTMPAGGWPGIVFIHGYIPPQQYQTLERYTAYVDYLARNGFVVLKIDLRGHGTSEGEPAGGYYSSGYVIDTLNAYAALQTASFVNPRKIGIWGHSMAGNIVLRSVAARPEIPAAVIWAGAGYTYTDLRDYRIADRSYLPQPSATLGNRSRQQLISTYGQPTADSPFWKQVAPTNYLNDLKGAIQIHHAIDDQTVNIAYSRNLTTLLDKTSVPHELYEYPSGGHNISDPSFSLAMKRAAAFFQKYLK